MSKQGTSKTIVLVGGGSGGHLTPLIAVADALKQLDSSIRIVYIGQKGENLQSVVDHPVIDVQHAISAGKFRRYHGESFLRHIVDFRTILLNIRDFFRFVAGFFQAWRLLRSLQADAIFLKGGFVSVPVGFAARLLHVPYITHDSDAIPGLANRLTAKHARLCTTALPIELYPYDKSRAKQVGIPIRPQYTRVTSEALQKAKKSLGLQASDFVLFVVGGGLGARTVNKAVVAQATEMLDHIKSLQIIHLTGQKLFAETEVAYKKLPAYHALKDRLQLIDFTTELYRYSAAADVVITRAGATNIAEFAAQAKPCIVIPNPVLTGGQQLHNARVLEKADAAVVIREQDAAASVAAAVIKLYDDGESVRAQMGASLHTLSLPDAAASLATILHTIAKEGDV